MEPRPVVYSKNDLARREKCSRLDDPHGASERLQFSRISPKFARELPGSSFRARNGYVTSAAIKTARAAAARISPVIDGTSGSFANTGCSDRSAIPPGIHRHEEAIINCIPALSIIYIARSITWNECGVRGSNAIRVPLSRRLSYSHFFADHQRRARSEILTYIRLIITMTSPFFIPRATLICAFRESPTQTIDEWNFYAPNKYNFVHGTQESSCVRPLKRIILKSRENYSERNIRKVKGISFFTYSTSLVLNKDFFLQDGILCFKWTYTSWFKRREREKIRIISSPRCT